MIKTKTNIISIAACLGAAIAGQLAAQSLRTVALSDTPIAGLPGTTIVNFNIAPTLNSLGQTAFRAQIGKDEIDAIFSEGTGSLEIVAKAGDPAPGIQPAASFDFSRYQIQAVPINNSGQSSFHGSLTGSTITPANDRGIWTYDPLLGSQLVARTGDPPPGTTGIVYDSLATGHLDSQGGVSYTARVVPSGIFDNEGIWSGSAGAVELVAREGSQAPGVPNGVVFSGAIAAQDIGLNSLGALAFIGELDGPNVDFMNSHGIWSGTAGNLRLVMREGDPAPGFDPGIQLGSPVGRPKMNSSGVHAFASLLSGDGINTGNLGATWVEDHGDFRLVAQSGDQAPDTSPGTLFDLFGTQSINAAGQTIWRATLRGSDVNNFNNSGVWMDESGVFELLVREGDQAPGTPHGTNFGLLSSFTLNAHGEVAFISSLVGPGIDDTNDRGIWAIDSDGSLNLVLRKGGQLEVAPHDFRTISWFAHAGGRNPRDGALNAFNDVGQIAFLAGFTDGTSGVFVTDAFIPEPSGASLLVSCLAALAVRHKR